MSLKLITVPDNFYKNKYFKCEPGELSVFLASLQGVVTCGEVELLGCSIDIEKTIKYHSGDCRIYYRDCGMYDVLSADQFIMTCEKYDNIETIFDWMEIYTPSLYLKHLNFED